MNDLNTENDLDQNEVGHLLQLATSSAGMIALNEENCQKLFVNGNRNVSIITLIADPDKSDSSLMKCLLQHGFKTFAVVDFELKNFSKQFNSSFEQLTEGDEPIKPQLITWSTPIMTNHGASNIIPLFVFYIIGDFAKSFEDPDFIALAGLALAACSSTILVADGELEVKAMEQLYPLAMQGLRSDQIHRYQQLQILIYDSDSLPYGNRNSRQILSDFWSRNSNISNTYYIRNLFQNMECFKLPKFINPQFKQYLTAFVDEAVDNLLLIKRSKTNQGMNGSDVLALMKKHAEEVPDADFNVNLADCFTREYAGKGLPIETKTMVKSKLDQLSGMYFTEIDMAKKTAIAKGNLEESHSAITLKLLDLLEQDFSHIPKQLLQVNKVLLKHRLDSFFERESIKFVESLISTQSASCKFASPIQINRNSAASYYAPSRTKEKVSVGIHFGASKVAMYYWDSAKGSAEVILEQSPNNLTMDGEFHVGKYASRNGTTLEMGSMFETFYSLELELLKPMKIKLKTESLLAVFFSRMRRIAESKLGKRIDLFVIAIPAFASVAHVKIIKFGCELINLNCKVVYESDASAIQYFGNVGSAAVLPVVSLALALPVSSAGPTACVISVLRNNSYDIVGYAEEKGKIKRTVVECKQVSGGIWSWNGRFKINEYIAAHEKVAQSLSAKQRKEIKTLLMVDDRNLNKNVISNISRVTSTNDVQCLNVCAAKGAAFWGSIDLDSKSAQDHWRKHHNSAITKPLLKKKGSVRTGHCEEREINFEPCQKETLINNLSKLLQFIDQGVEITKQEIRQNLSDKMSEMSGFSTYMKGRLISMIQTQCLLLDELDVDEVYCVEVQKKIEDQIDTVLERASK